MGASYQDGCDTRGLQPFSVAIERGEFIQRNIESLVAGVRLARVDPVWETKRTIYAIVNGQEIKANRQCVLTSQRSCAMLQATEGKLQRLKGKDMEDVSEIKSQTELNRLRWRSRRGMAELDVLFVPFFEEAFDALSADMKEVYARMLDEEDPELWSWFSEQSAPDDPQYRSLVSLMLNRVRPKDS